MIKYILSINKNSANALYVGSKKHEFRKRFPKYVGEARIFLYETSPVKAITGAIICSPPIEGSIDSMCSLLGPNSFDTEKTLRKYFGDSPNGYALPVIHVERFKRSVSLDEIRSLLRKFTPPMSFLSLENEKYGDFRKYLAGVK
ncbi:MAG: hypothetical protein IH845_03545 [Nanoarchaeota archaeon]|nr:hypothetical protein [Nanoarchaeota archaeon]